VPTRVLIVVDDHPLFLEGIGMLVDRLDDVELNLSGSTIKSHLQRLYDKLGVSDGAAAVAEAMRRELIH
jgi:hypothetical protein